MDLSRLRAEALKLSPKDRVQLMQTLLSSLSFETQPAKPKVIDREEVRTDSPEFQIERDPIVLVTSPTQVPKAIEIPDPPKFSESTSKLSSPSLNKTIAESFQELREALETSSKPE